MGVQKVPADDEAGMGHMTDFRTIIVDMTLTIR
jgi:hypothetical protein